jgi:hypothetical protein
MKTLHFLHSVLHLIFIMLMQIFRSKKTPTLKGNTIKKAESIDGRQARRDFHKEDGHADESIVNLLSVSDWVKESGTCDPKSNVHSECAVLKEVDGPRRATLVEGTTRFPSLHGEQASGESPNSLPMTAPSVTSEEDVEPPTRKTVDFLLGQQDSSSRYFTRRYVGIAASRLPSDLLPSLDKSHARSFCLLPELDPHAFELYQIWRNTGIIPFRRQGFDCPVRPIESTHVWKCYWPLLNAHILGCTIEDADFADQVIDILEEKLGNNAYYVDADTINTLFSAEAKGIPQVLQEFVVGRCIEVGIKSDFADLNLPCLPLTFVHFMLKSALRRLSSTYRSQECEFHVHETPETCYKKKVSPKDLKRKERLNSDREKSRKDSEQVGANTRINGIKTVDWEEQRAQAHRALRLRTGQKRVGFTRLGDCQPPRIEAKRESGASIVQSGIEVLRETEAVDDSSQQITGPAHVLMELPKTVALAVTYPGMLSESQISAKFSTPETPFHANGDISAPASSIHGTPSDTGLELQQDLEMALNLERKLAFPGAFPISRSESVRSTASK